MTTNDKSHKSPHKALSLTPLDNEINHDLSIFFAGDTLLGDAAFDQLKERGYYFPFQFLDDIYGSADLRTLNLEAPICEKSKKLTAEKMYKYKMAPEVLNVFKEKKFKVFYLANNHTIDYGHEGLMETIGSLDKNNMYLLGAGRNITEAKRPLIVRKGKVTVAILNYMSYRKSYDVLYNYFATDHQSGVAMLSEPEITEDIKVLRELGVNTIVVSIHWGKNYKPVTKKQKLQAKLIFKTGADVIIGHGSHQYQKVSIIDGKPVFYSLGNFVFTTPGRSPLTYGFPVTLYFDEKGLNRAEIWPISTNNRIIDFQPQHLSDQQAAEALYELFDASDLANLRKEVKNDKGVLYFTQG